MNLSQVFTKRIASIDFYRGVAIVAVVLYHYGYLPFGYLGVDLFFVISGFLVSGVIISKFKQNQKISFWNFFLRRGFKIWPSYYFFLIVGGIIAFFFLPDQFIDWPYSLRYLLFFKNYSPPPHYWTFDHVWSLCIEEHFYILLPIGVLVCNFFFDFNKYSLLIFISLTILTGVIGKYFGYVTDIAEYPAYTHNRIDALSWGVLLTFIKEMYPGFFNMGQRPFIWLTGLLVLWFIPQSGIIVNQKFFDLFLEHTLAPIAFFLLLWGTYSYNFRWAFPIKFIALYSYNLYLWHHLVVSLCNRYVGNSLVGFIIYIVGSFSMAYLTTIFIEEKALILRDKLVGLRSK